jgi:hypothetical protein
LIDIQILTCSTITLPLLQMPSQGPKCTTSKQVKMREEILTVHQLLLISKLDATMRTMKILQMSFISLDGKAKRMLRKLESIGKPLVSTKVETCSAIQSKILLNTMHSVVVRVVSSVNVQAQFSLPNFTMREISMLLVSTLLAQQPLMESLIPLRLHLTGRLLIHTLSQLCTLLNICNLMLKRKGHLIETMILLRKCDLSFKLVVSQQMAHLLSY